jgi:DNA-binding CsgD family transcriptional regulator
MGTALLRLGEALCAATGLADLARRFDAAFPALFGVPMYGLYVIEPWTGHPRLVASAGVSAHFLASYERSGREVDCLHAHLRATRRPAYNRALMPMGAWLEHPLYRRVKRLHDVRHEIQTPVLTRDGIVGNLNFGTSDPHRGFTPHELELAGAVGRVVGRAVERVHHAERVERERDQLRLALELTGTAIVICDPEPQPNDAARRLLAQVVDGETHLQSLIARPVAGGGFSRHLEVELAGGGCAFLHSHSSGAVTVLELEHGDGEICERTLVALTPREREVALRVVDGLSDREIAERLSLSPYTVRQYVKRIYRKVDVDSRVALTRLLLGRAGTRRRPSAGAPIGYS